MKTVKVKNVIFGEGCPKICVPLIGKTAEEVEEQAARASASKADLVEWRIDWFIDGLNLKSLKETSEIIRNKIGSMPLLITFRRQEEGGEGILSVEDYKALLMEICRNKLADLIDIEMSVGESVAKDIIKEAKKEDICTIGSKHDFDGTPLKDEMIAYLYRMQKMGFDMCKLAVMPIKDRDVITLMDATLTMNEMYADRPMITMSMKKMGLISRIAGEITGSCMTFGTAGEASAPGQIDAEQLKQVLDLLHRD